MVSSRLEYGEVEGMARSAAKTLRLELRPGEGRIMRRTARVQPLGSELPCGILSNPPRPLTRKRAPITDRAPRCETKALQGPSVVDSLCRGCYLLVLHFRPPPLCVMSSPRKGLAPFSTCLCLNDACRGSAFSVRRYAAVTPNDYVDDVKGTCCDYGEKQIGRKAP